MELNLSGGLESLKCLEGEVHLTDSGPDNVTDSGKLEPGTKILHINGFLC